MGHCYNSAVIGATSSTVWDTIRNFHDMSWAEGVVTKVDVVGVLQGDQVGAQRILNGVFHETLLSLDDSSHTFTYRIDDGPGPVSKTAVKNYIGQVHIYPITENNSTFIAWESTYDSPADQEVGELCNPIYQALLKALQKKFASGVNDSKR